MDYWKGIVVENLRWYSCYGFIDVSFLKQQWNLQNFHSQQHFRRQFWVDERFSWIMSQPLSFEVTVIRSNCNISNPLDFTIFNQAKWQIDHNCIIHNVAQSYSIRFVYIRCVMQWKAIKYLNRMDWCRREWAWVNERTQNNLLCGTRTSIRFSFDRIYLFAVSISEYQNAYTM